MNNYPHWSHGDAYITWCCWHLLKLVERRSFTVAFNARVAFVPCDSLNLTCLNVFWRQNSDCHRSQWMVCEVRLDSCSFCHLPQEIFQGVVPKFAFAFIPDVFFAGLNLAEPSSFGFWNNASKYFVCASSWTSLRKDFAVWGIFRAVKSPCVVLACHYCSGLIPVKLEDFFSVGSWDEMKHRLLQWTLVFSSPFAKIDGDNKPGCLK